MLLIKNPKGRIVDVDDAMNEYLLADKPKKTIDGREIRNKDGAVVVVQKAAHEKGFTKPTDAEIEKYKKQTAETKAADTQGAAEVAAKGADKVQKKADEENKKAADAKKAAEDAAKGAGGTGSPTPDN